MEKSRLATAIFFALFLLIGLLVFKDYGISWDEKRSRTNGLVAAKYVFQKDPLLLSYEDKYYGTVFELPLFVVEKVFNLSDSRTIYLSRHLVNFLVFYIGVFFFYLLSKSHFKSWKMGLLGSLFLILSPRIFAHSFYNSKDIPFLTLFIISIYTLIRYLDKKNLKSAGLHALACALLVDIRVLGIIVPVITAVFAGADFFSRKQDLIKRKVFLLNFIFYLGLFSVLTILFWPILWTNPFYHFIEAFKQMSAFPWNSTVLYFGNYVEAKNLPWHYLPAWLAISTPILYLFLFIAGLFFLAKKFPVLAFSPKHRNNLIFLLWFFVPFFGVFVFKPVLYDSWRQIFFVYPAFLLIALTGLKFLCSTSAIILIKPALALVVIWNLLNISGFMIKNHPYQNLYFNFLAGLNMSSIKQKFELDYWGLSYRKGLEYILANDNSEKIKIYVINEPGRNNADILYKKDRERLVFVETPEEAKYFMSNYRWHRQDYSFGQEIYSVKVGKAKIMTVYRL